MSLGTQHRRTTFDERAIPDLKPEAIDFRAASELFVPYRQLTAQVWSTLRSSTLRGLLENEEHIHELTGR